MSHITINPDTPLLGDAKVVDMYFEHPHAKPGLKVGLRPIATTKLKAGATEITRHQYMYKDLLVHIEFSPASTPVTRVVIKKYIPQSESLKLQPASALEQDIQRVTAVRDGVLQQLTPWISNLRKMD